MAGSSCRAPKSQGVRSYTRSKPRKRSAARPAAYVVTRKGQVVSRHRTLTGAISARKRLDRASFRKGQGRPYNVERSS